MYKLIIQDDEGKTTVVPLIRDEITIGRKEGNTIRLTERNVSRKHARIVKSNGSVVVEDLDSYNGVKVNGARIQGRVAVNESDRIQIGDYLLELKLERGNQTADVSPIPGQAQGSPLHEGAGATPPPSFSPPPAMPGGSTNGNGAAAMRATKPTAPLGYAEPLRADSNPPGSLPPMPHPATPSPVPGVPSPLATLAPLGSMTPSVMAGNPGRLVVVSSNFGGREFVLSKMTMVIGRTEDNDIVVNHRSISRHHAKVVLEQGRYCIVDMQSANGVRVNGEEYGKVELRRGDVIDLGHVRLRYVEPGEDFVFDRDAQIVDVSQRASKSRGVFLALLSVAVLGGGAAVFLITSTRSGVVASGGPVASAPAAAPVEVKPVKPVEATPAPAPPPAPAETTTVAAKSSDGAATAAPAVEAPKPATPEVAKPTPEVKPEDPAPLLGEARDAASARDWKRAVAAADKAAAADPASDEARKLKDRAQGELANEQTFKRFADARDGGRITEALKLYGQLPKESVYRQDAESSVPPLQEQFVKDRVGEAQKLAAKGQCDKIPTVARHAGELVPDARAAVERVKCTERATPPTPSAAAPSTTPPAEAAPAGAADMDRLIADAKEAAKSANWVEARSKADEVLRANPDNQDALSVAGIAACNLADKDRALKYISRLRGTRQNMMKQICAARGVMTE